MSSAAVPGSAEVLERLAEGLRRYVVEKGWSELRPIQRRAVAPILAGRDCVLEAPTAGGKTEAVLFPALSRAAADRAPGVRILYIAPLRALLNDLEERGTSYAEACGLKAFKWHGDVSQAEKREALAVPPSLLLITPESLEAILLLKAERAGLFRSLQTVVLDEAHNFAASDRGGHLVSLLERVERLAGRRVQRIAMSATVGNPEELRAWLAGDEEVPGEVIRVEGEAPQRDFEVLYFPDGPSPQSNPDQWGKYRRFRYLLDLLPGHRSLVFARSRRGVEELGRGLGRANERLAPGRRVRFRTHHSSVSKSLREEAETLIATASESGLHAIVTTTTLELGIDIGALDRVVQMGPLASPSSFLQRIGRTGRRPGQQQYFRGLTCAREEEELSLLAATVSLGLAGRAEAIPLPRRAFHLLAHQLLCLALQESGVRPATAWEILSGVHCFGRIRREEFDWLIEHMVAKDYLRRVDGELVTGDRTEREFLGAGWRRLFAVFDTYPLYDVYHGKQAIGTLADSFVEEMDLPAHFVLAGRRWKAERVDTRARVVHCTPSPEGEVPRWVVFGGPDVPFETAQEAGRILCGLAELPDFLGQEARAELEHQRFMHQGLGWEPGRYVVQMGERGRLRLVTFAGDRINRALARYLELEGPWRCAARYDWVEAKAKKGTVPEQARDRLEETLGRLGSEEKPAAEELAGKLSAGQRPFAFSPFARCLPDGLRAAALVDRTLDCRGLLAWMGSG